MYLEDSSVVISRFDGERAVVESSVLTMPFSCRYSIARII